MAWTVSRDGFALREDVLSPEECKRLIAILGPVKRAGLRNLLDVHAVSGFAKSTRLMNLVRPFLSGLARPVRVIYFDKTAEANWSVAWHQDRQIAVKKRIHVPGFGPWSVKAGKIHVQPPVHLLEQMLAVRLHMDDANAENGALVVAANSHTRGFIGSGEIPEVCRDLETVSCEAKAGDALLMRPLLLHCSKKARNNLHRRVIHIEYAGFDLPGGLQWAM